MALATFFVDEFFYPSNPIPSLVIPNIGLLYLFAISSPGVYGILIADAISKLEQAIEMNPHKHEAFWCLGNAHTSEAFFTIDPQTAQGCFERATESFQKAVNMAPQNETYLKSLQASIKAPAMHKEVQDGFVRQTQKGGSSASLNSSKRNANGDLKYDIGGWIILGVGLMAFVAMWS